MSAGSFGARKNCFWELKETTIDSLAKLFPNWIYWRMGPVNIPATWKGLVWVPLKVVMSMLSPTEASSLDANELGKRTVWGLFANSA